MLVFVYCVAFLNLFDGHVAGKEDFCAFGCKKQHTVCKRQPCPPNSKCGEKYEMLLPNDEVRQWILDIHNEFRDQVSAKPVVAGSKGATNMAILSYSKEIEFVAQCWANNCKADGPHDQCRSTSRFDYVGQNVYSLWMTGMSWSLDYNSVRSAIQAFFDEYKDTTMNDINIFGGPGSSPLHAIGHFTQLAWAETTHVGCGITKYGGSKDVSWVLVCNYGTGGNIQTKPVYKEGTPPCSACKNNAKCNAKYPTLCGESESFAMDTWTPPFKLCGEKISRGAMAVYLLAVIAMLHL